MKTEEALNKLGRSYTYHADTECYKGISCCNQTIQFDTFLGMIDYGKCEICKKSFTRKALLDDECFVSFGESNEPEVIGIIYEHGHLITDN